MPYRDPDPEDPNVLVGVSMPSDREAVREMAYVFAEEFAASGFSEERLLGLFRQPFYSGPHQAFLILGEAEIRRIIAEAVETWGRFRVVVREPQSRRGRAERLVQIGRETSPSKKNVEG